MCQVCKAILLSDMLQLLWQSGRPNKLSRAVTACTAVSPSLTWQVNDGLREHLAGCSQSIAEMLTWFCTSSYVHVSATVDMSSPGRVQAPPEQNCSLASCSSLSACKAPAP